MYEIGGAVCCYQPKNTGGKIRNTGEKIINTGEKIRNIGVKIGNTVRRNTGEEM